MKQDAKGGPDYQKPKGTNENETNKEEENIPSDQSRNLKDILFEGLLGSAQQQTGQGWQEDRNDVYGLSYEAVTEAGDQLKINLVTPQSALGEEEGLEQAVVKDFSLWKNVEKVYILGGDQDHEKWVPGGNQFYTEAHDPETGVRPLEKEELENVYDTISSMLDGKQGSSLVPAISNPEKQGYADEEGMVASINQQLDRSREYALNHLEGYWIEHHSI